MPFGGHTKVNTHAHGSINTNVKHLIWKKRDQRDLVACLWGQFLSGCCHNNEQTCLPEGTEASPGRCPVSGLWAPIHTGPPSHTRLRPGRAGLALPAGEQPRGSILLGLAPRWSPPEELSFPVILTPHLKNSHSLGLIKCSSVGPSGVAPWSHSSL